MNFESGEGEGKRDNDAIVSQLVADRLSLRRSMMMEKKFDLKEKLELYSKKDNILGICDLNPLQIIFPEEIWLLILEHMDGETFLNMWNVCHLFRDYMKPFQNLILFRKVLPILIQQECLYKEDLLRCRLASKLLCRLIDNFCEKGNFQFVRQGIVDFVIKKEILSHQRNPFIGRSIIALPPSKAPEEVISEAKELRRLGCEWAVGIPYAPRRPNALLEYPGSFPEIPEVNQFIPNCLEKFGSHIWYLTLGGELNRNNVVLSLGHCQNLKSLEIREMFDKNPFYEDHKELGNLIENVNFRCLTSLTLSGNNDIHFQNRLLEKFSGQLKELRVACWLETFCDLDWSNLKILKTDESRLDSEKMLKSLYKMKAKKLNNLSVNLNGKNFENSLLLLLQTIHHFPELNQLSLDFNRAWEISEADVKALLGKSSEISSASLKSIHVTTGLLDDITYSFLVFFPFLENLKISYGLGDFGMDHDDSKWFRNLEERRGCAVTNEELYRRSEELGMLENEILEIRKYLYKNRKSIYDSVVWNILPFLRCIKIKQYFGSEEKFLRDR